MFPKLVLRCIGSLILFSAGTAALGATPQPVERGELKKALAFYQSIARLDVDFKQTKILKDIQLELKSEGHLTLTPPSHVQWKVLKPELMTVDLEQGQITIHNASGSQSFSQSQNPSAKDRKNFTSLLSWLKLDADAILSQYDVTRTTERHYHFNAKDSADLLKSLDMELTSKGHVSKLSFQEISGDEIQLQFATPKVVERHP